jgi:hypothetical protein
MKLQQGGQTLLTAAVITTLQSLTGKLEHGIACGGFRL